MDQISLKAYDEEREPTPQNVVDLFKGAWKILRRPVKWELAPKLMFEDC